MPERQANDHAPCSHFAVRDASFGEGRVIGRDTLYRHISEIILLTVRIHRTMIEPRIYKRRWPGFYIVFLLQHNHNRAT